MFEAFLFLGDGFLVEGLMAEFEELVSPFVVLGLGDLILGAELIDFD